MEDTKDIKIKKKKLNKNVRYIEERKQVLQKIYDILNITETNKLFYAFMLDQENVQNKIDEMTEDFRKYFTTSKWPSLRKNSVANQKHIAIVRSILKEMDITYKVASYRYRNEDGSCIPTTIYIL